MVGPAEVGAGTDAEVFGNLVVVTEAGRVSYAEIVRILDVYIMDVAIKIVVISDISGMASREVDADAQVQLMPVVVDNEPVGGRSDIVPVFPIGEIDALSC